MFNVGDRVEVLPSIILQEQGQGEFLIGKVGVIRNSQIAYLTDESIYAVAFDFFNEHLHSCNCILAKENGWFCAERHLRLLPEVNVWDYIKKEVI